MDIELNEEKEEDLVDLDVLMNTPKTTVVEKTPGRNDPCICGSGKNSRSAAANSAAANSAAANSAAANTALRMIQAG